MGCADHRDWEPQLEVGSGLGSTLLQDPHLDFPSMETCLASLLLQESGLGCCPHPGHNTLCPPRLPRGRARRTNPPTATGSLCPHPGHPFPLCHPQVCFLAAVNVIGQRMNFMVILHGCWLVAILTRRRREAIARLWPNYCLFLALFLLYQYLLCLGVPPALCIGEWATGWAHAGCPGPWCGVRRLPPAPPPPWVLWAAVIPALGGSAGPSFIGLPESLFSFCQTFYFEKFQMIREVESLENSPGSSPVHLLASGGCLEFTSSMPRVEASVRRAVTTNGCPSLDDTLVWCAIQAQRLHTQGSVPGSC